MSEHRPEKELDELLKEARAQVEVGAEYTHYKDPHKWYLVTGIAIEEATDRPCVIYQAQYGEMITYTRPLSSWLTLVETEGGTVARFTKRG